MTRHLSDRDLSAAAAGLELSPDDAAHLAACAACRDSVRRFDELVAGRRAELSEPAPDWRRQRQAILDGLPPVTVVALPRPRRWRILAAAAVVMVAVGVGAIHRLRQPPPPAQAADIEVEEVLAEVDALLADDSIPGLWPVDPLDDTDAIDSLIGNGRS